MSGTPQPPASEEVTRLRTRIAELGAVNARLREVLAMTSWPRRSWRQRDARIAALTAQAEELRRRGICEVGLRETRRAKLWAAG